MSFRSTANLSYLWPDMTEPAPSSPESPLAWGECGGARVQGFLLDKTRVGREVIEWIPDSPQRSFWTGVKLPDDALPLGAFRCSQCGYVEFYADEVFRRR